MCTPTFDNQVKNGTWQKVNDMLRCGIRMQEGRDEEPSAVIFDCQSVKTAEKGELVILVRVRR